MHRALKSAVISRIFVHSALKNPIIALKSAVFSRNFVHCALKMLYFPGFLCIGHLKVL